jgi:hypothetical protein
MAKKKVGKEVGKEVEKEVGSENHVLDPLPKITCHGYNVKLPSKFE